MKKRLILLPMLGGLLLSGCQFTIFGKTIKLFEKDNKEQKDSDSGKQQAEPKQLTADITINYDTLKDNFDAEGKYVYPQSDYEFTAGGISFNATSGVGQRTQNKDSDGNAYEANYYYEQHALQFRKTGHEKGAGIITVAEPVIASKITVHWYATYATEASQYHPVVFVGDTDTAVNTKVSCNEGSTVTGVKTTGKERGSDNKDHEVYDYTTTYNISGKHYFAISAPNGAMYVKDIVINK